MVNLFKVKKFFVCFTLLALVAAIAGCASDKQARTKAQLEENSKKFEWWPSDAKPAPVKDTERGGYWWWPNQPGQIRPWGNRGYVYVFKFIYDYKEEELPPAQPKELRPSLLIRKIIKNVKVYFDYDKATLRQDGIDVLYEAVKTMNKNPQADILITGNCDIRGSEQYNEKLGKKRAEAVKQYMRDSGIPESRIRIVSRGKLDAVAPVKDIVGMAKDRNAQFMIAEVEEVMIPAPEKGSVEPVQVLPPDAQKIEEGKYIEETQEEVASKVKVSTRDYTIKKGDSLWSIAQKELGSGHRWKYLYELNKDVISNPNKLKAGKTIVIPVE